MGDFIMNDNGVTVNANKIEPIESYIFFKDCDPGLTDIAKLFGITAQVSIIGCESLTDELRVNGRVTFQGFYRTSAGVIDNYVCEVEFNETVPAKGLLPSSRAILTASVTETESSPSAKIKATIEIGGYFISVETLNFINGCGENLFCRRKTVRVESIEELSDTSLETSFIFEPKSPIKRLLTENSYVWINNVFPSSGAYRVEGETSTSVTALDENGKPITQYFSSPFSLEISDQRITAESDIVIDAFIKSARTSLDADNGSLAVDLTIVYRGYTVVTGEVEGVADVYSTTNELQVLYGCYRLDTNFCKRLTRTKISEAVQLDKTPARIEGIMAPSSVSVTIYNKDGLTADGVLGADILYTTEEGETASTSVKIPFRVLLAKEYDCSADFLPTVLPSSLSVRSRGGDEAEVTAELIFSIRGVSKDEICLVGEIVEGAPLPDSDIAISLYISSPEETLFDVAKALTTTEENLLRLNPELSLPLKGGEKILLYK